MSHDTYVISYCVTFYVRYLTIVCLEDHTYNYVTGCVCYLFLKIFSNFELTVTFIQYKTLSHNKRKLYEHEYIAFILEITHKKQNVIISYYDLHITLTI